MTQPAGIEGGGMGALTDEAFGAWLDAYGRASAADDPDASAALFATDASYHESPFDAPIVGREAIRRYWAAGALRFTDKRSTYEVIAVRDDIGAARWRSWFTVAGTGQRRALDCIFVARFGDDGTCVEFHEWWHGAAVDDEGARGPPKRTNRTGRADAMLPSFPVADPSLGRHPGRQRPHPTTEDRGHRMTNERHLTIGFPRMYNEPGERRAFLPPLIGLLADADVDVYVEAGSGLGMGYSDDDYARLSPRVHLVDEATAYAQDIVVVLRAPEGRYELVRPGAILLSMLHFNTRPERVELLRRLGIDAVAIDMVTGDDGRRLVQNLRDVARNGLEAAFAALERRWPPLLTAGRPPVSVTILGAGGVGKFAIEWAAKAGDEERNARLIREGLPGVEVVVAEQNLAGNEAYFRHRLALTDILVDATARRDTSKPLFPNAWLGLLPPHAVVCDLAVDPYLLDDDPPVVRGIEGIPQGNLDQWEFGPDDPAWDRLPPGIPTEHRRTVVSCYSWPGVQPERCMELYGSQMTPLIKTLIWYGGSSAIGPDVSFHGRALWRGSLRRFAGEEPSV